MHLCGRCFWLIDNTVFVAVIQALSFLSELDWWFQEFSANEPDFRRKISLSLCYKWQLWTMRTQMHHWSEDLRNILQWKWSENYCLRWDSHCILPFLAILHIFTHCHITFTYTYCGLIAVLFRSHSRKGWAPKESACCDNWNKEASCVSCCPVSSVRALMLSRENRQEDSVVPCCIDSKSEGLL